MSCEGIRLGAYLDGELDTGERAEVETHLGSCRGCAEELRAIAAASAAVKAWRPERRGFRGLPLFAAAAALVAAALLIAPGRLAPRAAGVVPLRAGERVRHAGAREYVADGLARPAEIDCAGGTLLASHARFRLEDRPMRTRTKVGAAVAATAAVVIWGTIEVTDRAGRRTLGEGAHEIEAPAPPAEEAAGGPGAAVSEPQPPGDPFEAVTGVVLAPDGSPAEGASVTLTYLREYAGSEGPDETAETDAEGRFRIASARREFVLAASKPRVGAVSGYFTPGVHAVLTLRAGARVEGRLLDRDDGTPVAGALVSSQMAGGPWGHARAVTGDDGRFTLDGLDPHESTLWIRPRAHGDLVVRPRLAAGETAKVELKLARSEGLLGRAVDATTGLPVVLSAVEVASNPQRRARLLGDGRFEVQAQRYGTSVVLVAEGYPDTAASFGSAREHVFRMDRGVLVRLRARDDADHAVQGVRINLIRSSSVTRWRDLATGEDGDAVVRLPRGTDPWVARARHPRLYFENTDFTLGGSEPEIVLVLRARAAGRLAGRVLAPGGAPAAGARVEVAKQPCFTLEDGRFLLDGLPPGRLDVRVATDDATTTVQADLRAGEETDLGDVVLREGATISGFVTRPDGSRVDHYKVWSWPSIGVVEPDGSFRIAGLEKDRECAVVVDAGNVRKSLPAVRAGTENLEIRLDDYAAIEGRVVVPDGDELPAGLSMACAPAAGASPRPYFDITLYLDGGFHLAVPAGRYVISADGAPYARAETEVEAVAGATTRAELRLVRGGTVEVKVVSPLASEKVLVTLSGGALGAKPVSRMGEGSRFDGVPPGEYTVEARTFEPGFRGTSRAIAVRAGETARCDLALIATGELLVRAPAGTALSLLDAAGRPVEASRDERNAILQRLWESAGSPELDKAGRDAFTAQVDEALAAADAEGAWRRLALFPGEYVVAAGDRRQRVTVRGGQTTELDLR